jgi:ABC-type Na+ efflux pump permease subunit
MTGSGSSYSVNIGTFAAGKTVSYYVEAKDAANNVAKSPSGSFTVQGTADTEKPVITSVAHSPASPTPSDDVIVSATITDNVAVKTAEVKYDDGSGVKTATMAASGSTFSANIGKFAAGATVTYHVEAKDAANNLQKSADGTFTVATSSQLPDVTVTSIQTSPASPKIGDKVTITATVQNVGTGDASNVNVAFSIAGAVIDTKIIPSIVAGGSSTAQVTWTAQNEGSKDLKVEATASGDNNAANNAKTSSFTVSKGGGNSGTGTGGSAMLMWMIPIIVIIVVVVVLLMLLMRRKKPAQQSYYQQDMFGGGPQW